VSLGISDTGSSEFLKGALPAGASPWRGTVQWFPDVPDESVFLNEASFSEPFRSFYPYQPLNTMAYGGVRGIHLSKLVEIAVWIVDYKHVYGIEFMYNTDVDGQKIHTLGRRGQFPNKAPRSCPRCNQRINFPIDGPGGEIINGVDIQTAPHLPLEAFKVSLPSPSGTYIFRLIMTDAVQVHTNRGRMAMFPPDHIQPEHGADMMPVHLANSTIITGFYAELVSQYLERPMIVCDN